MALDKLITRVGNVMEYLTTRRAIVAIDAVVTLVAVVAEVDHRDRYSATYRVMATRSAKISEGPAAAKAAKAAKKPA